MRNRISISILFACIFFTSGFAQNTNPKFKKSQKRKLGLNGFIMNDLFY